MALWRRGGSRIYPQDSDTDWTGRRRLQESGPPSDDYILETEIEAARPPVGLQAIRVLQAVLIVAIAVLSFAVFWIVAMIFGIL